MFDMAEMELSTPIDGLEMPDRLKNRLRMCGCATFRDVMEEDYSKWMNVSAKVVNAIKRFKNQYGDIYSILLNRESNESKESNVNEGATDMMKIVDGDVRDNRRFYVANNILNAYISSGRLFDSDKSYKDCMTDIMRATDAFMEAYNDAGRKDDKCREAENTQDKETASDEESLSEEDSVIQELNRKESLMKAEGVHPIVDKGEIIMLTKFIGKTKPTSKHFKIGDEVMVENMNEDEAGVIKVIAIASNLKRVFFDSNHYEWTTDVLGKW